MNNKLTPCMIAREIAYNFSNIVGAQNYNISNYIRSGIIGNVYYNGIVININSYNNDKNLYFDIIYKHINFTLIFLVNKDFEMFIDNFVEYKLMPDLYKKLEAYGYATWD